MARRYAANTKVPIARTQEAIRRLLLDNGVTGHTFGEDAPTRRAMVEFCRGSYVVRFTITLPATKDFSRLPNGMPRAASATDKLHAQACRQRWRALLLLIKAKLEAVAGGVQTFESEFLPYFKLPSGETVADAVLPRMAQIASGEQKLLGASVGR